MKYKLSLVATWLSVVMIAGCSDTPQDSVDKQTGSQKHVMPVRQDDAPVSRWYSWQQVQNGRDIYQQYCAECHQPDASGTASWRQPGPDGKYPPPPLDGSAHTWHHHLDGLRRTVRMGGVPLGGSMPAFGDKLSAREIDAVLAWVQSRWPDKTYTAWSAINARAQK